MLVVTNAPPAKRLPFLKITLHSVDENVTELRLVEANGQLSNIVFAEIVQSKITGKLYMNFPTICTAMVGEGYILRPDGETHMTRYDTPASIDERRGG